LAGFFKAIFQLDIPASNLFNGFCCRLSTTHYKQLRNE